MSYALAYLVAFVGLAVTAVTAAAEGALDRADKLPANGRSARPFTAEPARSWVTIWILSVLGPALFGVGTAILLQRLATLSGNLWATATGLFAITLLVFARLMPLTWAARHAEGVVRYLASPVDIAARALWPVRVLFRTVRQLAGFGDAVDPARMREDALRVLVGGEEENSAIEDDEMEMITGIMELGETMVREVMVPRIDIIAIPIDTSLDDALDTIIKAGHSRIPVFRESIDDIAGLLYAKDLLKAFRSRDFTPVMLKLLRQPYYVPQSKPVDALLEELQVRKVHMAIVVDEYGGTAGLVTIEDLIEEIVGEIQDEYDHEEPRVEALSDDEILFNAGIDIDDVNKMMDIVLPTKSADTLAGLVFTALGRVPQPGDVAAFDDADIEVLELDARRIHRVRVVKRQRDANGDPVELEPDRVTASPPSAGSNA